MGLWHLKKQSFFFGLLLTGWFGGRERASSVLIYLKHQREALICSYY